VSPADSAGLLGHTSRFAVAAPARMGPLPTS
jgi:hypothetical protein